MTRRRRPDVPQNLKPDGTKNVHDPAGHPMDVTAAGDATRKRRRVSGDANMRLPHEHDETGDPKEAAGGTDELLERAADDAKSDRQDTDRRSDAVEVFERNAPRRGRRR